MSNPHSVLSVNDHSLTPLLAQARLPILLVFCKPDHPDASRLLTFLTKALPHCQRFVTIAAANPESSPGLATRYGVGRTPTVLLLSRGIVHYQFVGQFTRSDLETVLARAEASASEPYSTSRSCNSHPTGVATAHPDTP